MRGISVKRAAELLGGELLGAENVETEIKSVVIDSRLVTEGAMFAAFKGERVDGHDYIEKAFELGAVCCLAEHAPENPKGCIILVHSVFEALKSLAEYYRGTLDIPVIGISGSVGKTTAKEMVSAVLSQRFKVLKTDKNLNNELGVPLTVFRIEPEHEAAVIEMGISDFGEMTRLARIARPTMALFTLIGHAHLEHLHDREGVLRAKTEMLELMPEDGTVFLNADDSLLAGYNCAQRRVLFGTGENADVRAENVEFSSGGISCDIVFGDRRIRAEVPAYGKHMLYAALEGAAVGLALGLSDSEIAAGIKAYVTVGRRASVTDTGFITLIDDCYNANPDSVICGIDSLKQLSGRKICILGDMLEMGENVAELHASVGLYAAENGVELLLTVGKLSEHTHAAAKDKIKALHFESNAELISKLSELIQCGDAVLVKASHSMKLEEISEALKLLG